MENASNMHNVIVTCGFAFSRILPFNAGELLQLLEDDGRLSAFPSVLIELFESGSIVLPGPVHLGTCHISAQFLVAARGMATTISAAAQNLSIRAPVGEIFCSTLGVTYVRSGELMYLSGEVARNLYAPLHGAVITDIRADFNLRLVQWAQPYFRQRGGRNLHAFSDTLLHLVQPVKHGQLTFTMLSSMIDWCVQEERQRTTSWRETA